MKSYGDEFDINIKDLKEMVTRKYRGYLTNLKRELFLKRTKKVNLPKPATTALLNWWNAHCRWPYPTVIILKIYNLNALRRVVFHTS